MPPGPPVPKIVDVTNTSIDISWIPPLYNGGGEILGYHIERCLVGEKDWVRCTEFRCKDRKYTVTGLTEGADYYLRVYAVNDAGHGAPGMTEPVQAKEPEGELKNFLQIVRNEDLKSFSNNQPKLRYYSRLFNTHLSNYNKIFKSALI